MKKKALSLSLVYVFVVFSMLSVASAENTKNNFREPVAVGAGTFIHSHEGELHTHYFTFSVTDGNAGEDGWHYEPNGKLFLVCLHPDKEICMIVRSDLVQRFRVNRVEGGLSVVFEGVATVKMHDADWEKGWLFEVEAFDYSPRGADKDFIHILLTAPDGTQHHMEGTLTTGNIVINE